LATSAQLLCYVPGSYADHMTNDDHIKQHLELCKRIYQQMREDGSWPWRRSPADDQSDTV
jgi:hypothetical protein